MLHAALLAAALSANSATNNVPATLESKSAIAQCFATMDGPVYHGDPSDRRLMRANVATCVKGIAQINATRALTPAQGPEKLFIAARVLERAAMLSYMGLDDAPTALREVTTANLYFRIASGLRDQSQGYHEAALANVELTRLQLSTLHADPAIAGHPRAGAVTAYHRL